MTVHQPMMTHHALPWGLELLGAAIIGAALLFGILLAAGHSDLLPWNQAESTTSTWVAPPGSVPLPAH
jgi:hypothetical protein